MILLGYYPKVAGFPLFIYLKYSEKPFVFVNFTMQAEGRISGIS
jgi:hypothetical protein